MIQQMWLSRNVLCDSQVSLSSEGKDGHTEIQICSSKMSPSMECFHCLHKFDWRQTLVLVRHKLWLICCECRDNLSSQATSLFCQGPCLTTWTSVKHCNIFVSHAGNRFEDQPPSILSPSPSPPTSSPAFFLFFLSSDWFKNASASIDFTPQSLPRHPTPARPGHVL